MKVRPMEASDSRYAIALISWPETRLGEFSERGEESVAVKKNQFNQLQSKEFYV